MTHIERLSFLRHRVTFTALLVLAAPDAFAQSNAYRAGYLTGRLVVGGLVLAIVLKAVMGKKDGPGS